ncbi:MAG TPA: hypothetical protein VFN76_02605 [Candidatus Limnocylindria bacterium]|nr:hypothetical protein [Candidatus Limnocylindria bacterium]
MTLRIRSILAISILAVLLAACANAAGSPQPATQAPTPVATPSEEPSEQPSEAPADEERDVDGTLTIYPGTVSGPGGTIQEALDNGPTGDDLPVLVNGVLFKDTDGRIYLATAVSDEAAPTFDAPMLEVIGLDSDGPEFDIANADVLGLQEANGIVFRTGAQILGTLEIN